MVETTTLERVIGRTSPEEEEESNNLVGKKGVVTRKTGEKEFFVGGKRVSKEQFEKARTSKQIAQERIKKTGERKEKRRAEKTIGQLERSGQITPEQAKEFRQSKPVFEKEKLIGFQVKRKIQQEQERVAAKIIPGEGVFVEVKDEGISKEVLVQRRGEFKKTGLEITGEFRTELERVPELKEKIRVGEGVFAELKETGEISEKIFVKREGEFKETSLLIPSEVKKRVEAGEKTILTLAPLPISKSVISAGPPIPTGIKGAVSQFKASFKEGFSLQPTAEQRVRVGTGFEALGFTAGAVSGIATLREVPLKVIGGPVGRFLFRSPRATGALIKTSKILGKKPVQIIAGTLFAAVEGKQLIEAGKEGEQEFVREALSTTRLVSGFVGFGKGLSKGVLGAAKETQLLTTAKAEVSTLAETTGEFESVAKIKGDITEVFKGAVRRKIPFEEVTQIKGKATEIIKVTEGEKTLSTSIIESQARAEIKLDLKKKERLILTSSEDIKTIQKVIEKPSEIPLTIETPKGEFRLKRGFIEDIEKVGRETRIEGEKSLVEMIPSQARARFTTLAGEEVSVVKGETFGLTKRTFSKIDFLETIKIIQEEKRVVEIFGPLGPISKQVERALSSSLKQEVLPAIEPKISKTKFVAALELVVEGKTINKLEAPIEKSVQKLREDIKIREVKPVEKIMITTGLLEKQKEKESFIPIESESQRVREKLIEDFSGISKPKQREKVLQKQIQEQLGLQEVLPASIQEAKAKQLLQVDPGVKKTILTFKTFPFKPTPVFLPRFNREIKLEKLFDIEIGKPENVIFRQVRGVSLPEALRQARGGVLGSAAASFKLTTAKGKDVSFDVLRRIEGGLGKKFRRSKKDPSRFVQKREFRIKTLGEFEDITKKGLRALRERRTNKIF